MTKRFRVRGLPGLSGWARALERQLTLVTRQAAASGARALKQALRPPRPPRPARTPRATSATRASPVPAAKRSAAGHWTQGAVAGAAGVRRYRLWRPAGVAAGERLPLLVMLHGCGQDAAGFAASTRMNRIAARERFLVLYPEQDRLSHPQGCWNWFLTDSGRAQAEAALVLQAIDQVCLLQPVDRAHVAVAGLSAGASLAALLVTLHPARFVALVMHSGIAPGAAHSALTALGAMQGRRAPRPLAATPAAMQDHWPPLLVIHGSADGVVSPRQGAAAALAWADAAGAKAGAVRPVQRGRRHASAVTDYRCRGRTVATLVAVQGLAHAWSGGAASQPWGDAKGPDASRLAWAFVARQLRSLRG